MDPTIENSPYKLIVEGPEDLHFFVHLQEKLHTHGQVEKFAHIQAINGRDQAIELKRLISGWLAGPASIKAIGIIRDADDNPESAFQSVKGTIATIDGTPIPAQIGKFAASSDGNLRIGILVLPHDRPGIREDVCIESIPNTQTMSCVDNFINCIRVTGMQFHSEPKARLLAYLAAQQYTDGRIGIAVQKGYIPWDSPAFSIISDFLTELTSE